MSSTAPLYPERTQWDTSSDAFEFLGLFYNNNNQPCRRILDIRIKECNQFKPDLLVIMMNPGGSFPKKSNMGCNHAKRRLSWKKKYKDLSTIDKAVFVPTCPDQTQWKIVEFMKPYPKKEPCFNYARVLNLSDICKPKLVKTDAKIFEANSIFVNDQCNELLNNLGTIPVLLAWGTDKFNFYNHLAVKALIILEQKGLKIYGYRKPNTNYFYHPLIRPNKINKLGKWLESIKEL
jgi:hypothetical protein